MFRWLSIDSTYLFYITNRFHSNRKNLSGIVLNRTNWENHSSVTSLKVQSCHPNSIYSVLVFEKTLLSTWHNKWSQLYQLIKLVSIKKNGFFSWINTFIKVTEHRCACWRGRVEWQFKNCWWVSRLSAKLQQTIPSYPSKSITFNEVSVLFYMNFFFFFVE